MRIPRFIVSTSPADTSQSEFILQDKEAHHLRNVLRKQIGDTVEVGFPKSEVVFRCQILELTSSYCKLVTVQSLPAIRQFPLTLLVGMPRPKTADFIAEKCTELGIYTLRFFEAERSQSRLSERQVKERIERLDRVCQAALKQSGLSNQPRMEFDPGLEVALGQIHGNQTDDVKNQSEHEPLADNRNLRFIFDLSPTLAVNQDSPQKADGFLTLNQLLCVLEKEPKTAESYLIVGPEGGLTSGERDTAREYGYRPVSLGPKTLKTDTAALVACAFVGLGRYQNNT